MFSFFGKNAAKTAAKCGAKCVPGLNAVIITAEVAGAAWTIYNIAKDANNEAKSYRRS